MSLKRPCSCGLCSRRITRVLWVSYQMKWKPLKSKTLGDQILLLSSSSEEHNIFTKTDIGVWNGNNKYIKIHKDMESVMSLTSIGNKKIIVTIRDITKSSMCLWITKPPQMTPNGSNMMSSVPREYITVSIWNMNTVPCIDRCCCFFKPSYKLLISVETQ